MEHAYAIRLQSKFDGKEIWLGTKYKTFEDAVNFAQESVCMKCNRIAVIKIPQQWMWVSKEHGFRPWKPF